MTAGQYHSDQKRRIIDFYQRIPVETVNFIGIDRSLTNTGFAVVKNGKLTFQTEIKTGNYGAQRLVDIVRKTLSLIAGYENRLICMESYSYNSKFGRAFDLGELGGVFKAFFFVKNITYLEAEPTVVKKYVTGKGNTPKDLIPMFISQKFECVPQGGDAADAIACAYLAYQAFAFLQKQIQPKQTDIAVFNTFLSTETKKAKKKTDTKQLALELGDGK